jgi:Na+/H+ antiporter NhaA
MIMVGTGMVLLPAFLVWNPDDDTATQALAVTSLTIAASAAVWLFSPMRLQAEMGVFLIVLAIVVPLFARQVSTVRTTE